jgi:lysophospholipase L1-like esterase
MSVAFRRLMFGALVAAGLCVVPVWEGDKLFAQGKGTATGTPEVRDVSTYPQDPDSLPGKGPAQRWSDFPKIWAQRHAEWRESRDQEHGAVVFLGDSITQGWTSLKRDFPEYKVANRGIGGDTTRGVLYRLDADVLSLEPTAVVLLIGTNDIGLGGDPEEIGANIREIVAELRRANGKMPIILCKVMPRGEPQHNPAEKIKKLNALLEGLGKPDSHVAICDTWSIYAGHDGECKVEEFPDRLHPNATGYAKWAASLRPALSTLVPALQKRAS